MFGEVIAFGLFEMIQKKSEDHVLGSRFGPRVGSSIAARAATG